MLVKDNGRKIRLRLFLLLVFIAVIFFMPGCHLLSEEMQENYPEFLEVHFIDVGQGDASLLRGPDFTILIDAGRHDRDDVVPYLIAAGVFEIDLLIGTHPHADHIGQFDKVLQAFPVKEVWMSGDVHTTRTFERVLDAILASEASYYEPERGEQFRIGSLDVLILNPSEQTGRLNDGSISLRAQFGEVSFLFTGDAEESKETEMLESGLLLESEVFQLGHHGSSTSNTKEFLEAVNPGVAIYSAEQDNPYGHPHTEIIERLKKMDITVFGTDQYGTIIVQTNGHSVKIVSEDRGEIYEYGKK